MTETPTGSQTATFRLPPVATVSMAAPMRWLASGWADFRAMPGQSLAYGFALFLLSVALVALTWLTGTITWVMVLAGGFLFVAPMLAMGLYEAARLRSRGQIANLSDMAFVKTASTRELAYLGLALVIIYFFWGRIAQLIYALSTFTLHRDMGEFLTFMFTTPAGIQMAITGTIVGAFIAFLAYCLIVVSAPMLLNARSDVFAATATSVRAVLKNMGPMILWAGLIAGLTALALATAFVGLIIVFPVLGYASWHAYRDLVPGHGDG